MTSVVSDAEKRRAARASWITTVVRDAAEAEQNDREFWLAPSAEERIDLVARLSLEAYRRSGDPNARPELQRSVVRISRP
jgi:hypothetical protein